VRDGRFKNSFIFKYSERPGTKAAERYPDDVPEETKKRRNNDLLAVQNANSLVDHRAQIGKEVSVLVEGFSRLGQKATGPVRQLVGRAMTDHIVVFDGTDRLIGQTVAVRVTDASPFTLYGTPRTTEVIGAALSREAEPSGATPATRIGLTLV
jgi:tRNA-2-methylthio-N6-dimethylallyladenosine synthase